MAYSDFSVTQGNNISAGNQNQNMINIRHLVSGTNATAPPSANENIKQLRADVDTKNTIPIGTIFSYTSTTIPSDYLSCDGSSLNKVTYSELYNIIGFTYGGTGNTYSLPDLKDSHMRGHGTSTIFTQNGTTTLGDVIDDQLQGHEFDLTLNSNTITGTGSDKGGGTYDGANNSSGTTDGITSDGVNGTPRTGNQTKVHSIGVQFIIKYQ